MLFKVSEGYDSEIDGFEKFIRKWSAMNKQQMIKGKESMLIKGKKRKDHWNRLGTHL